jgi:hypothetical protein
MADQTPEAQRLADQRTADLAAAQQRDVERAVARGRKEAEDDAFRRDTTAHFAVINGSIADAATTSASLAQAVNAVKEEVRAVREEQMRRDLVNEALIQDAAKVGANKLSRLQRWAIVVMGLIAFLSLAVAVVTAIAHT